MIHGPLLGKVVRFALPLMFSGILQLLFNAADIIVVGRFCGSASIAAVGATGSTINLLVALCIGFTIGTNVLVAQFYGAGKQDTVRIIVHTSVTFAMLSGLFMAIVGELTARPLLILLGTPEEILPLSLLYMRIYYCGLPILFTYNFSSAVLRAVGETLRPMYYLIAAGVLNVALNLFFVIVLGRNVDGVALATVISQLLSCSLVIRDLTRSEGCLRLEPRRLGINFRALRHIIRIGLPASLQSALFSISNMQIQSSVNSFGPTVMAGGAAAANLGGFVYTGMSSITTASTTFTSQNYGAGKYERLNRVLITCLFTVTVIGFAASGLAWTFRHALLSIYTTDEASIEAGMLRMLYIIVPYFLCGIMEVICGAVRGIGYEVLPMIVSLLGACVFRIFWVQVIFRAMPTQQVLYVSYPISWILTGTVHFICYLICKRKAVARGAAALEDV